jgi:hypothetical protein
MNGLFIKDKKGAVFRLSFVNSGFSPRASKTQLVLACWRLLFTVDDLIVLRSYCPLMLTWQFLHDEFYQ